MNAPTPEKSVEEIVEESVQTLNNLKRFVSKKGVAGRNIYQSRNDTLDEVIVLVRAFLPKTLQAERQKRDEMVEEGVREFAIFLKTTFEKGHGETAMNFIDTKALTQPNNPE